MNVPKEIIEAASSVASSLLPAKSASRYEREYDDFKKWQNKNSVIGVTEDVLLVYLNQLSARFSPNTLWAKWSMLKSCLEMKENAPVRSLRHPKFFKRLSAILCVLLILLFITLIVIVVAYSRNNSNGLCTTNECIRSAANLRYSLDLNIEPCENFYQFTCGRWSDEHPNHGWFPSFSTFSTISERVMIASEKFLTSPPTADEPKPVSQARDFYKSCMDSESIDKLGLTAIYKYLKVVGLPLIPSLFNKSSDELAAFKFDWLKMEAVIKKTLAMDVFIGFEVGPNNFNRTENVMYIGVPGNECPLPSPIKTKKKELIKQPKEEDNDDDNDDTTNTLIKLKTEANTRIIRYILTAIIQNVSSTTPKEDKLDEAVQVLLNFTEFVNELIANYTDYLDYYSRPYIIKDLEKTTNAYTLNNANKEYPHIWTNYVDYLFEDINVTVDTTLDPLYIEDSELEYLPKILSFILSTTDVYLELYMWWVTVYAMIMNTSSNIVEYISIQTIPFYGTSNVIRSRSMECASLVNNFMGMAMAYGLADKAFSNKTKPKVEQMLYDIKNAFVEHVKNIKWMDKETKQATLEKTKEMISFIGYPEWIFEKGGLESYYKGLVMKPETYLDNMMSLVKDIMPSKLGDLRETNERDWRTDPIVVNAFNSFPDNAINIPMAILNFPIYNLGLEVLNYGAIGTVIGHELTHGFDNKGRKHDKFGNYKQWWTNKTIETFEEKINCFIKQYDNFTVDGVTQHVQGLKTLGENLADNGGLNHAYIAYQHYLKSFGEEPKLPGFETFTNNQLFFIAFASIWCETTTLNELEEQVEFDEHCPNSIRVIGTLRNSPDFAKAFNCPVGSYMNPKTKCKVW